MHERTCVIENFSIKEMERKREGISLLKVLLCCQNFSELVYLLRVGFQNLVKSGSSSLRGKFWCY
jgi:hypothetical protein